jgi:chemotaxis protein CheZ
VADNLTAALKDEIGRGLAQDIRDRVVQIFEACNFQDLTSQRVAKVMLALKEIEAEIARALAAIAPALAAPAVHGPRLESDSGHASQRDIDLMFDRA